MSCVSPVNNAGPGCAALAAAVTGKTVISYATASATGTIVAYRFQPASNPGTNKNVEFAFFTKSVSDYDSIAGTESGVIVVPSGSGANCNCYDAGEEFTAPSTGATSGNYLGCYYEADIEMGTSGGAGWAYEAGNQCEAASFTPDSTDADGQTAIGADITAGGGGAPILKMMNSYRQRRN